MIKDALQYLKDNLKSSVAQQFGAREFTLEKWNLVPNKFDEPVPDALIVNTLTGFSEYIKNAPDVRTISGFIHVVSPSRVDFVSALFGDKHQRMNWVTATTENTLSNGFRFDRFMSIPEFIISIQAYFSETGDVKSLLTLVSNIKAEQGQEYSDNGVSQSVVAKRSTGSSMVATVAVPNPVSLRPYRTFLEVEQPESSFVFRLSSGGEGNPPQCGLWEASGGSWKLDAIQKVKAWLLDQYLDCEIIA